MCATKMKASTKKEGDIGSRWGSDKGKRKSRMTAVQSASRTASPEWGEEPMSPGTEWNVHFKKRMELMDQLLCLTTWKVVVRGLLQSCCKVWEELGMVT